MKFIVHDYAGHPFQVQLSRRLAARGHEVLHLYCASTHTPRGELQRRADDPPGFEIRPIALSAMIPKNNFVRRYFLEVAYAKRLVAEVERSRAEVILSGNTPSIPQVRLARWCRNHGVRLVSWVQDVYGLAAYRMLRNKLPGIGQLVGKYFIALDKSAFRRSDAIVVISEDFTEILSSWGIDRARIHTIHNWAPLDSLSLRPRDNDWSRAQGLGNGLRFVYSGTLSMRHNPALLLELARMLQDKSLGELVVVSEGPGVDWLAEQAAAEKISTLKRLGFQPFEHLSDVLGSADVLVAILEPDAGVFCVPSKVLSYLCAGRPVLLAVPTENLVSRIVAEQGAGLGVEPTDVAGFCAAALELAKSPALREKAGRAARQYAETHFDVERITDRFEQILRGKS
ncbi:MAG: glycosyltransferase family 4 protein [Pirellulales bacterium]